ncbi:unnamed protein product [Nippostrongylus brasiliensis]|uniref:Long-chain-fatty-acid--CoA ligase n=1 Tax=Nippostrongylus brasiliensis TaxID=27835 RepID=A0A0N4XSM6_NIPBR|nr:unnamed protein product [Nippostrongylus brasiliensis]
MYKPTQLEWLKENLPVCKFITTTRTPYRTCARITRSTARSSTST